VALTSEQRAVLHAIHEEAARRNARGKRTTPMQVKAAVEIGKVENNLTNRKGGDADSSGWRQERASLYKDPDNLRASINRAYDEMDAVRGKYTTAGDLAAAIQRPAAQYRGRYQQQSAFADQLLGFGGAKGARRGTQARTTTTTPGVDNSAARAAAIAAFLGDKQADPLSFAMQVRGLRDTPGTTTTTGAPESRRESRGTPGGSGRNPTARRGKLIGGPNQGTHTLGNWQSDNAVDIGVPVGTPMVALQDGVVVKVKHHPQGSGRFAGDQITVKGANGNEYFYAHGKASVKPGQRIRKGQSLGSTGSANGVAHLHFGQMKGDPRMHT
jgi:murein DD-endopeptidase MepM/ murein hydrolase activator NlpD